MVADGKDDHDDDFDTEAKEAIHYIKRCNQAAAAAASRVLKEKNCFRGRAISVRIAHITLACHPPSIGVFLLCARQHMHEK